jgi:hypothetical protein
MSGGGGGSKQTTSSTQTNTPFQQNQNKELLAGADAWLKSGGYDQTYAGGIDTIADMTQNQQAGLSGQVGLGTSLQNLFGGAGQAALSDYLGEYDPRKTGLTGAIDATLRSAKVPKALVSMVVLVMVLLKVLPVVSWLNPSLTTHNNWPSKTNKTLTLTERTSSTILVILLAV